MLAATVLLSACAHKLTMHARDGEKLDGRWRFAREGSALMQVFGSDGEVLVGMLTPVARRAFFESYQSVFGRGAIAAETPDLSAYGHGFWMLPGTSNALTDVVYGDSFDAVGGQTVVGPLFYWTANLQGDTGGLSCIAFSSVRRTAPAVSADAKAQRARNIPFNFFNVDSDDTPPFLRCQR